ncbi:DUF6629 family protein [Marimonas arenosa]|uniref:Uncharacterized protein n=1 Tax=Marimonas arenosa TaxID=1795305 RepID=A0AAE3WCN3_9RHOB|nr:DUF6629 family protein [Marimonas arenosa]MDQ2090781.1 hypothetical protein [Marimonas arenosa]
MCFSATASFALSAALMPAGVYAMARARRVQPKWLAFAAFPVAFSIQQGFEGLVWLGLNGGHDELVAYASRGFLFFSHFFWLAWVPFAVWMIEPSGMRRRLAAGLAALGFFYGLSIFLPSFLLRDWLYMEVINRSLEYRTTLIYEDTVNRVALRLFYAAIVVSALFVSSDRRIQFFGLLVLASLALTYAFFAYAFISVWCFFAAILSAYLTVIIARDARAPA